MRQKSRCVRNKIERFQHETKQTIDSEKRLAELDIIMNACCRQFLLETIFIFMFMFNIYVYIYIFILHIEMHKE